MPSIKISEIIDGYNGQFLWHGTRANINGGLNIGINQLEYAKDVATAVWDYLSKERGFDFFVIENHSFENFFSAKFAEQYAIELGVTTRLLKSNFVYDVIAFATTKHAAGAYAKEGSELANALLALFNATRADYPEFFDPNITNCDILEKVAVTEEAAKSLINGVPKLYRLKKIPQQGYFSLPNSPTEPTVEINVLLKDSILPPEVFFTGTIPLEYLEEDSIPELC